MKTFRFTLIASIMTFTLFTLCGCQQEAPQVETSTEDMPWVVDRFDDIKVLRYEVPGFENLPLQQKLLVYYLAEAAKCGRDILFDQNFKYNLTVRRAVEDIYTKYEGDRKAAEFVALEKYLKKVWFANGIHHHYSNDKFRPEFPREWFEPLVAKYAKERLTIDEKLLCDIRILQTPTLRKCTDPDGE